LTCFDTEDLDILAGVSHEFCTNYTASLVSALSHNNFWQMVELGERIPIGAYLPGESIRLSQEKLDILAKELIVEGLA
jgi:hypothetical protein